MIGSLIPAGGFRQAAENDRFATANPSCGGLVPQMRNAPQSTLRWIADGAGRAEIRGVGV